MAAYCIDVVMVAASEVPIALNNLYLKNSCFSD